METKSKLVWRIFQDEGYWYFQYMDRGKSMVTSPKMMTRELARKALQAEIQRVIAKYGSAGDVEVVELKDKPTRRLDRPTMQIIYILTNL